MAAVARVASPPAKPLLIYDGDCGFCRAWARRWQDAAGGLLDGLPLQDDAIARQLPELARPDLERSVHLVEPDGSTYRGAEAVFRARALVQRWPLWLYHHVPGLAFLSECAYRVVASNRGFFSFLTRLLWGADVTPDSLLVVRSLFLRALGLVYAIAFLSLGSQVIGLSGQGGIVPVDQVLAAYGHGDGGAAQYYAAPTLCWLDRSDRFLRVQCAAGAVAGAGLMLGMASLPCAFVAWLLYLSLSVACPVFLGFQWDALLLETGLLSLLLAPVRLWPGRSKERPPSRLAVWLLRGLLFKLMFASGVVKLASHDAAWRSLTALSFHFETQPLPTWIAWYFHQLPAPVLKALCAGMFAVELAVPFLFFFPRRARRLAFWLTALLELVIALTGNYTFFNLLTIVLCLLLLDDRAIARGPGQKRAGTPAQTPVPPGDLGAVRTAGTVLRGAVAIVFISISAMELLDNFGWTAPGERMIARLYRAVAPLRSINPYGLFAIMTTERPEIVIEGSPDGVRWIAYELRHKPGDLKQRPRFVAPHQPRLDWQMWFAALGDARQNPWFISLCARLLQGRPEVLALFRANPFPGAPPKFVRARLYDYHFTTFEQRRADGAWWRRTEKGEYCPALSLGPEGRLQMERTAGPNDRLSPPGR